jgi:hypothetical protein
MTVVMEKCGDEKIPYFTLRHLPQPTVVITGLIANPSHMQHVTQTVIPVMDVRRREDDPRIVMEVAIVVAVGIVEHVRNTAGDAMLKTKHEELLCLLVLQY